MNWYGNFLAFCFYVAGLIGIIFEAIDYQDYVIFGIYLVLGSIFLALAQKTPEQKEDGE